MPKSIDFIEMGKEIIEGLGGPENLKFVNHCATRVRVNVVDLQKVDEKKLKSIDGVLGVSFVQGNNEVQVIVGQIVEDVFSSVEKQAGVLASTKDIPKEKKGIVGFFANFLMMMAGIMSPIIPPLIVAGLLSVLILILQWCGIAANDSTITILTNLQQTIFYFLPIYVAYTSAKKFDTEPILAMVLGAFLVYPGWEAMVENGTAAGQAFTQYFGIPVMLKTYSSSVLQSVIAVFVMSKIDKWLKKVLPINIRHVVKPFILLLVMSVLTLVFIAPLGAFVTDYIYAGMVWVRNNIPWLGVFAIILFSTTIGVFMPGFHLALMPIAIQSIAAVGYDDLINIWFYCCTITPAFIALAVGLKTKNKGLKQIAFPASLSAFFGISEPTTYGISYKIPRIYFISICTSLAAGLVSGIMGLRSYGFGAYSLTNILLFLGPDKDRTNFLNALIVLAIMAVLSFAGVFFVKWDDRVYDAPDDDRADKSFNTEKPGKTAHIHKPVEGEYVEMASIKDQAISSGALGKCFGVTPKQGNITSPVSGTINSVAPTKHAITIMGDNGEEIMVHIGLDSIKLQGKGIEVHVKAGDKVSSGQRLAAMDLDYFHDNHIDDTVVTILLNSGKYADVEMKLDESDAMIAKI